MLKSLQARIDRIERADQLGVNRRLVDSKFEERNKLTFYCIEIFIYQAHNAVQRTMS